MRPFHVLAILVVLLAGWSQTAPLSGGKPADYWVKAMQGPDAGLRKTAVCKLGNAGAPDAESWTALCGGLRDRDAAVRREAILAIMKCGPRGQEAIPVLAVLERQDPDAQVRVYAGKAAKKLRSESGAS